MRVLVDPEQLGRWVRGDARPAHLVLLDVRWSLGRPNGAPLHAEAHIPGAVYVDLDAELAAPDSPAEGRHPLPTAASLEAAARRWGVRSDSTVVAYDDAGGTAAARAWWLLRWGGLTEVFLLDGGLAAWRAAGLPVEAGPVTPAPGDVVITGGHLPVVDADGAARLGREGVLLDARAAERYRGEVEPVDPRPGHIPGARSAPTTATLADDGRLLPAGELRERFAELGVDGTAPVAVYCGSGVTAAHQIAALAAAGYEAALYPGSWSQWSNDPARPAAVGPEPG